MTQMQTTEVQETETWPAEATTPETQAPDAPADPTPGTPKPEAPKSARRQILSYIATIAVAVLALLAYFWVTRTIPAPVSAAKKEQAQYRQWDLEVTSPLLMDDGDVMAIRALSAVDEAEAVYRADASLVIPQGSAAVTVMSATQEINPPVLVDGSLPETAGECAVVQELQGAHAFTIGQIIQLESDTLSETEYTITGIFRYPLRGNFLDAGNPDILVKEASFDRDALDGGAMRIYVCAANTVGDRSDSVYWTSVQPAETQLQELAARREALRVAKLRSSRVETPTPTPAPTPVVETPAPTIPPEDQARLDAAAEKLDELRKELDAQREKLEQREAELGAVRSDLNEDGYALNEIELQLANAPGTVTGEEARQYSEVRNAWYVDGEAYLDTLAQHEQERKKLQRAEESYAAELQALEQERQRLESLLEPSPEPVMTPTPEPVIETPVPEEPIEDCTWQLRRNPSTVVLPLTEETEPEETEKEFNISSLRLPLQMLFLAIAALAVWFQGARIISSAAITIARPQPVEDDEPEPESVSEPETEPATEKAPDSDPEEVAEDGEYADAYAEAYDDGYEGEYDEEYDGEYEYEDGEYDEEYDGEYEYEDGEYDEEYDGEYEYEDGEYDEEYDGEYEYEDGEYDEEYDDEYEDDAAYAENVEAEKDNAGEHEGESANVEHV